MTRRRDATPLSDSLTEFLDTKQPAGTLAGLQRSWPVIVGSAIAKLSSPAHESAGVVTVNCEDSVVAHELQMTSAELLEKLHSELPNSGVSELRFRARK